MARMGSIKQRTEGGTMEKSFLIYVQKLLLCGMFDARCSVLDAQCSMLNC